MAQSPKVIQQWDIRSVLWVNHDMSVKERFAIAAASATLTQPQDAVNFIYVTSQFKDDTIVPPGHKIMIEKGCAGFEDTGLSKTSYVHIADQQPIDYDRIGNHVGRVPPLIAWWIKNARSRLTGK